ncbi:hypothetical protein [Confluentibacter lentus]|uniref:hypothetical protein n=1 Tax=Confluentibacter lentus TaxID=1699412 RepID=UPI000C289B72|nr:hypothetical protein [Confluentibacter lentus]
MDATTQKLLAKISELLSVVEKHYPELQKYLDETRTILPKGDKDLEIDKNDLEDYLNSLTSMVDEYKKGHKKTP